LGQFIDHNITFDPTTVLGQVTDAAAVTDFRPPRLDLAHVYGAGPTGTRTSTTRIRTAPNWPPPRDGVDLARTSGSGVGRALPSGSAQ